MGSDLHTVSGSAFAAFFLQALRQITNHERERKAQKPQKTPHTLAHKHTHT